MMTSKGEGGARSMLVTLTIATLILLAVFVSVAVVGGLLVVVWRQREKQQHDELLKSLLEVDEHRRQGRDG